MNRHVGASFTLSVLAVVFFAVILYEPEHARSPRAAASAPQAPEATGRPAGVASAPAPTPGVPLTEALPDAASEPIASTSAPAGRAADVAGGGTPRGASSAHGAAAAARSRVQQADAEAGSPTVRVVSNRQARSPARRSAFTQVAAGESLADVAIRVYGSPEATNSLWRANRDVIDDRDASLQAGTLLRTP